MPSEVSRQLCSSLQTILRIFNRVRSKKGMAVGSAMKVVLELEVGVVST